MSRAIRTARRRASEPEVWYLFPSANPDNAARCVPAWRDMGYRVALLEDRTPIPVPCDAKLTRDAYPGWSASINLLTREVVPESCPVVVAGADDLYPDPTRRATEIAAEFLDRFPDTFGVMQPIGDDFEATASICGSPWLGRAWTRRMYAGLGGLCERYVQQYADEELYWVARCADRLWLRPELTQRHEHFRRLGRPAPRYWIDAAASNEAHDCRVFIERSAAGFPGAAPEDEPDLLDRRVFTQNYDGRAHERYARVLAPGGLHDEAARRMGEAIARLEREGARTIAIFGAGQHTHRAAPAFGSASLTIDAILDDDPVRSGASIAGVPVVSPEAYLARRRPDAIVLSSDTLEPTLYERARRLAPHDLRLVRLYIETESHPKHQTTRCAG